MIGIIAVLISILLPALQAARDGRRIVQCALNMRQIGMAAQMYVTEWKQHIPARDDYIVDPSARRPPSRTTRTRCVGSTRLPRTSA